MSSNNTQPRPNHGYIDPDWPDPNGPNDIPIIIYGYVPSPVLAIFAGSLFLVLLAIHLAQAIRYRARYFYVFPVGLAFEVVGYVARALSGRDDPYNLIYFVLNYFFIVTAPVFLAAGVYTTLSALVRRLGREYCPLPPRLVLWIFVTSDVVATVTQITGAALIGVRESRREDPAVPGHVLLAGLAYQVFSMGAFVALASAVAWRARRRLAEERLRAFAAAFAAAALLVYLRTCFRLAETAQGLFGFLSSHEAYFGALEFAPVALAVVLFAVWHPGRCVGRHVSGAKDDA